MQTVQQPGSLILTGFVTATGTVSLVAAGINTKGVIITNTTFSWFLGAVNSTLAANIQGGGAGEFCHSIYDDNGAAGPINIPRGAGPFENRMMFAPGGAILFNAVIAGTVRCAYSCCVRIL